MFFKECLFSLNYRTIYSFEKQGDINKLILFIKNVKNQNINKTVIKRYYDYLSQVSFDIKNYARIKYKISRKLYGFFDNFTLIQNNKFYYYTE